MSPVRYIATVVGAFAFHTQSRPPKPNVAKTRAGERWPDFCGLLISPAGNSVAEGALGLSQVVSPVSSLK